jgi:hypothetical protein
VRQVSDRAANRLVDLEARTAREAAARAERSDDPTEVPYRTAQESRRGDSE